MVIHRLKEGRQRVAKAKNEESGETKRTHRGVKGSGSCCILLKFRSRPYPVSGEQHVKLPL